jgi:hypothetical protein
MPRTANFPHQMANACLPEAAGGVDDTAALDTAVAVLDADAAARHAPLGGLLCPRERPAPRLLGGHDALDLGEPESSDTASLAPLAACGQGIGGRLRPPLVVGAARGGVAQAEEREDGIAQPPMVHGLACFLAPITARRLTRVVGARDAPCRPVMATRGEATAGLGAAAGSWAGGADSCVGTTSVAASASVTPIRWASSGKARLGASPRARRLACRPTSRT